MYYLMWFIVGVAFCILVFILLMVALGNKVAIRLTWWTGWFFFWFGLFFWWFLCIGFKVLNWIVAFLYEFFCASILFVLGGRRKRDDEGTVSKRKRSGHKGLKVEVNCQGPAEVTAVRGDQGSKKLVSSSGKKQVYTAASSAHVSATTTTGMRSAVSTQRSVQPPIDDTSTPAPISAREIMKR